MLTWSTKLMQWLLFEQRKLERTSFDRKTLVQMLSKTTSVYNLSQKQKN